MAEYLEFLEYNLFGTSYANASQSVRACMDKYEELACGQFCAPQQIDYLNTASKTFFVCKQFCDSTYDVCKNIMVPSLGKTIQQLYPNSRTFCERQTIYDYSIKVNLKQNCYEWPQVDASRSHSETEGLGNLIGSGVNAPGIPEIGYCLNVHLEDIFGNPKFIGGDEVKMFLKPEEQNQTMVRYDFSFSFKDGESLVDMEALNVTDNSDGTYQTCYSVDKPGKYQVIYSVNDYEPIVFNITVRESTYCPLKTPSLQEPYYPRVCSIFSIC